MKLPKLLAKQRVADNEALAQNLACWFRTTVGQRVLCAEAEILEQVLPRFFGYYLAHIGPDFVGDIPSECPIKSQFRVVTRVTAQLKSKSSISCIAKANQLPFESDSVDALLLHHCLDIEGNVHHILREASRVILPGGSVVVVGFNPWSLWGLWRILAGCAHYGGDQAPWGCRFISPYRLSDWLNLLDFEVDGCETTFYLPAWAGEGGMARFRPVHALADRYLNHFGALYVLVAHKRKSCMTPIKPKWHIPQRKFTVVPVAHVKTLHVVQNSSRGPDE